MEWVAIAFSPLTGEQYKIQFKKFSLGASLMVQWLRLCASSAGGPGSIPGQANISYMLQRRDRMLQLKLLHATTNTWHTNICVCVCVCVFICVYIYVCMYIYMYI